MKCKEIDKYFRSLGSWVNWEETTDIFTFGCPDDEIEKIAVGWKPSLDALRQAKKNGANFFISHESIAVKAVNGSMKQDVEFMLEGERQLFDFLKSSSMVVYRCHDFLDAVPHWGVMHTWQKGLKLGGEIIFEQYPDMVTQIAPMTVRQLASHIVKSTENLGQTSVQVSGDTEKMVSKVSTATGCLYNLEKVRNFGADVSIVVDDAFDFVRTGSYLKDIGYPVIVVNHGVAEEWAMGNLWQHLNNKFPNVEVDYIRQRCAYEVIQ